MTPRTIAHHRAKIDQHLQCIEEITAQLEAKYAPKSTQHRHSQGGTVVVAQIEWYLDFLVPEDKYLEGAYYFDETKIWYFEQQTGVDEAIRQGKRAPTGEEFQQLHDRTRHEWTKRDGLNGMLFTDKENGNQIFFPAYGYRYSGDGSLNYVGSYGVYWSSSIGSATNGLCLNFTAGWVTPQDNHYRKLGFPLRCER